MENTFNLSSATVSAIQKSLQAGYNFAIKAGEQHELTLQTLNASKISWSDITAVIQSCFKDWPLNDKGNPKGFQKAISEDNFDGAKMLNRFNSYRQGKYSDYGVSKVKAAPKHPAAPVDKAVQSEIDEVVQTTEQVTTSKANTFDSTQVSLYLSGIFGMEAIQNDPDAIAMCQGLADKLGVKLPSLDV